jgi:hypothetical protein
MTFRKQNSWLSGKQTPLSWLALTSFAVALSVILSACSGSAHIPAATASGPQLYMTPQIEGGQSNASVLGTFSIDDAALTFAQQTYSLSGAQSGAQVNYSGDLASPRLARGLEELELTYCGATSPCTTPSGWAVELADQSGGLAQLVGRSFVPLVPAVTCPSMSSAETFLFVTLPSQLITSGTGEDVWNPQIETAYGSVDISASGDAVTLANIKQYILPSAGGGTPANAPISSVAGACSQTVYGNTVSIPPSPTITIPGRGSKTTSPQAMMGIGPSGLLVEDNGDLSAIAPYYENVLGAGTGAIGLPKPSSAADTGSLVGAQYLGFFYGSGSSSSVASFGFPSLPTTCPTPSTTLTNPIYGGDFTDNDPGATTVQNAGGYGNCDFIIDLGLQSSTTNGLYTGAKVWVGAGTATNKTTNPYSFDAVAIAGKLNGKYAIFLIGEDTAGSPNQAWGIYLLQSN